MAEPWLGRRTVVTEEQHLAPRAGDEQVKTAVAGPVGQRWASVAKPRSGGAAEPAVGTGIEPEPGAPGLDRLGQAVTVLDPSAKVLGPVEMPRAVAEDDIEAAVAVEVADRDNRMTAQPERARLLVKLERSRGHVAREGLDREDTPLGRAEDQLRLPVAVKVGGNQARPILGQDQRGVGVLEGPGLHQDRRTLASEVPVDLDQPSLVGDQQFEVVAPTPGDRKRGRVEGQVKPAGVGLELRLDLEPGMTGLARVLQPANPPLGCPASPEAIPIVAGMATLLVEADLLLDRQGVRVGPVSFQVVETRPGGQPGRRRPSQRRRAARLEPRPGRDPKAGSGIREGRRSVPRLSPGSGAGPAHPGQGRPGRTGSPSHWAGDRRSGALRAPRPGSRRRRGVEKPPGLRAGRPWPPGRRRQ